MSTKERKHQRARYDEASRRGSGMVNEQGRSGEVARNRICMTRRRC
jgi:hypothetical protein